MACVTHHVIANPSSQPSLPPPSGPSKQDGHTDAAPPNLTGILELRVNSSFVRLYPDPPSTISDDMHAATAMTPGTISPATHSICLLSGPLGDFLRYSRQEASKWLIDLAHDICDPASLVHWRPVANTDPLTASIYRYDLPVGITVGLSKISQREGKSVTTATGNASTMAGRVRERDGRCWVSAARGPIVNSHICPKRMGDHIARIVYHTFTSLAPAPNLSIYDENFSLSLSLTLDTWFDTYEMGLRFVSLNNYECHMFASTELPDVEYTIHGLYDRPTVFPAVHGHPASPPRLESNHVPPAGLFRWHYLQCVLKKFAHDDYKNLPNIYYSELPLRMEGDSDDDGTDSEADWPSKALDLGRDVENSLEEREERHRAVAKWISKTV
ncbi:hypothetical protein BDZ89DRAFT_1057849 [Hymenopellis radicata]|nr:hypothetical protein BDZ89DRAFT_1057849 [Hymenopellis radicata]